jgi:hypothetical protein
MAIYKYIALTCAKAGREQEFDAWYDGRHLGDVAAVPGVKSAVRFGIKQTIGSDNTVPNWRSLALYEIETDGDPAEVIERIRKRYGSDLMPRSDALDGRGMLQILAEPVTPSL